MKGILLAGGHGTRLHPVTRVVSKQLLPVFDKPMVHYPLSTLMLAGVREILVISTPQDLPLYRRLLGDGTRLGLRFEYAEQPEAKGSAQALVLAKDFLGTEPVALVLGDNVFYGYGISGILREAVAEHSGATIFGYRVRDANRYGVAVLSADGLVTDIVEKPKQPPSDWAVTGLYLYDAEAVQVAASLTPSGRGELEITDVNRHFAADGRLRMVRLGRGIAWLDTGTHESLLEASQFIGAVQHRQGVKVGCLEEIAFRMGFIDAAQLKGLAHEYSNDYRDYLLQVAAEAAGR